MLFYSKSFKSKRLRNCFIEVGWESVVAFEDVFPHIFLSAKNCYTLKVFNVIKKGKTMADFNQILTPGDVDAGIINVVNEIPEGSCHKIEWNRKVAAFQLDRVEPAIFAKPTNYGFIPQTLDEDGDELDVLLLTRQPLATGVFLEAKVIGVMKFVDDGEVDDKIVCVPADDRDTGNAYNSLADVPAQLIKQIEFHFNNYKALKKPGSTKVTHWGDIEEAKEVIRESIKRWNER